MGSSGRKAYSIQLSSLLKSHSMYGMVDVTDDEQDPNLVAGGVLVREDRPSVLPLHK